MATVLPDHRINAIDYALILQKLAVVHAIAFGLRRDLDPLSEADVAAGLEPIEPQQIQAQLDQIERLAAEIALIHLASTPDEWREANASIH